MQSREYSGSPGHHLSIVDDLTSRCSRIVNHMMRDVYSEFGDFPPLSALSHVQATQFAVDVTEDLSHVTIRADAPGLEKEQIDITVSDDNVLTISAERVESRSSSGRAHFKEIKYGKHSRSVALPQNCDASKVHAKMENGVLTITMPKVQLKPTNVRRIAIN